MIGSPPNDPTTAFLRSMELRGVSLERIREAARVLRDKVIRTPLVPSPTFSKVAGAQVFLKLENLQKTGSFKLRGASYKMEVRRSEIGPAGVVAASAGNHAQGVALASRRAGFPAVIVMPEWSSITKQKATEGYGGRVILEGQSIGESIQKARQLAAEGRTFIHPFDDPDIICGQGTIGLEVLEDLPDVDVVVAPIGGGGLISGIAVAMKALSPRTRVIGIQASACPSAWEARRAGAAVNVDAQRSIADGIAVKEVGALNLPILTHLVDGVELVSEEEIADAVLMLLERKRILAEGAAAVGIAALLRARLDIRPGTRVAVVISGGNVDVPLLDRIIRQGLFKNGRIMRFSICLDDVPGTLSRLLDLVAALKANVLHIHHDRSSGHLPIQLSRVELEVETRGPEHIRQIAARLEESGYSLHGLPDHGTRAPEARP
ncbi:MAG: threonine ammonia-lyase [Syntrophobacteraceae bacterium]|jgi:threonine dehydratase|nr:threonine ammonia-lyase [Syntrophobacteraceae bacterium]